MNLPDELVERVDRFIEDNDWGYRSRAEIAASAIRAFLMEHGVIAPGQPEAHEDQARSDARRNEDRQ